MQTIQYIDKNGVLSKLEKNLNQVEITMDKIMAFEENGQILRFIEEQKEIVEFLSKNNINNYVNSIDKVLRARNVF